jgi:GNAT superfamily N-acetyltransferase
MSRREVIWSGQCTCGDVTVSLDEPPLFVHACHCLDCQARSGSAFSLSGIIAARSMCLRGMNPDAVQLSPRTTLFQCERCHTPLYMSSTAFPATHVLKIGGLGSAFPPQAHIWVKRKQPWVKLPQDVPAFAEGYSRDEVWSAESLRRMQQAEMSAGSIEKHIVCIAGPEDRGALQRLYSAVIAAATWLPESRRVASDFDEVTKDELVLCCVDAEGALEGFISVYVADRFVHHLYVAPGLEGGGIGLTLLESLPRFVPLPWTLKCVLANSRALQFYRKHGWVESGRGDSADGPYLVLTKPAL